MWILIVLALFFVFVAGILIMPLELEISTITNVYEVRAGKFFGAMLLVSDEGVVKARVKLAWWHKDVAIFPFKTKEKKKPEKEKKSRKKGKPGLKDMFRRLISVIKSFKVKRFYADIDTGDYIANAYLYPLLFIYRQRTGRQAQVNFEGKSEVDILIQNNLLRIGWAFIRYK